MTSFPLPIDVLPHRPPFLFIDRVTSLEVGVTAVGHWKLTGDEWFFPGHFPGRPTLPGVLMCEAIAQLGAYALLTDPVHQSKLPLFGGLDGARFVVRLAQVMNWNYKQHLGTSVHEAARVLVELCSMARSHANAI